MASSTVTITVAQAVIDANDSLPPAGEPYSEGVYETDEGDEEEFVPGVSESCPKCNSDLEQWFVAQDTGQVGRVTRHRPLLAVCVACDNVAYKDELVSLVPGESSTAGD